MMCAGLGAAYVKYIYQLCNITKGQVIDRACECRSHAGSIQEKIEIILAADMVQGL